MISEKLGFVVKFIILGFLLVWSPLDIGADTANNVEIHVIGQGATLAEARQDAVRQAVQQAVDQLIVVDTRIENDDIVRDTLISTMNGYVTSFTTKKTVIEKGITSLHAVVTVSSSGIENYIAILKPELSQIDGETLGAEIARQQGQRAASKQMLINSLRGFPSSVIDATTKDVKIDPSDSSSILITVKFSINKQYLESHRALVEALSLKSHEKIIYTSPKAREPYEQRHLQICYVNMKGYRDLCYGIVQPWITQSDTGDREIEDVVFSNYYLIRVYLLDTEGSIMHCFDGTVRSKTRPFGFGINQHSDEIPDHLRRKTRLDRYPIDKIHFNGEEFSARYKVNIDNMDVSKLKTIVAYVAMGPQAVADMVERKVLAGNCG